MLLLHSHAKLWIQPCKPKEDLPSRVSNATTEGWAAEVACQNFHHVRS